MKSRYWGNTVNTGTRVYYLGGHPGADPQVEYALINVDGTLGPFVDIENNLSLPERALASVLRWNQYVYLIGGIIPANIVPQDAVWRASVDNNGELGAFAQVATLTRPRADAVAVVVGDRAYVMGGWDEVDGGQTDASPGLASIETADLNGSADGGLVFVASAESLSQPRAAAVALRLGDDVYLVGGANNRVPILTVERSSTQDGGLGGFSVTAGQLFRGRQFPAALALQDKVVVVGGGDVDETGDSVAAFSDLEVGTATGGDLVFSRRPTALNLGRYGAALVRMNHHAYVCGGAVHLDGGPLREPTNTVERFAVVADADVRRVNTQTALRHGRVGHTVVGTERYVLVVGGHADGGSVPSEFGVVSDGGSLTFFDEDPQLQLPRHGHCAAVLGNTLFAVGGQTETGVTGTVAATELLGGRPQAFVTAGNSLVTPRADHTCVMLGEALYVLGGRGADGTPLNSVERAMWTDGMMGAAGLGPFATVGGVTLVNARYGHRSAVVGGTVLVLGGMGVSGPLSSVEQATVAVAPGVGTFTGVLGGFTVQSRQLTTPRAFFALTTVGDTLYLQGGTDLQAPAEAASGASQDAFEPRYGAAVSQPRVGASALWVGQDIYVLGGSAPNGNMLPAVERFEVH